MYKEHIHELQGMPIKLVDLPYIVRQQIHNLMHNSGRRIRLFMAGDYEFLCRLYGLSGASGKHNAYK